MTKKPKKSNTKPGALAGKPGRSTKKLKDAPQKLFYLLDAKGEAFDVHKTRADAYHDATGPWFYKGYFIVEYVRRSARRYKYVASMQEVVRVSE